MVDGLGLRHEHGKVVQLRVTPVGLSRQLARGAVIHYNDVLHGFGGGENRPEELGQRLVHEDNFVFGVVDNVRQLLGE